MVNPLHNVVHVTVGAVLVIAAHSGLSASRTVNVGVAGVYLSVAAAGLFVLGSEANLLVLNGADIALQFASAALLLGVGLSADRASRDRASDDGSGSVAS